MVRCPRFQSVDDRSEYEAHGTQEVDRRHVLKFSTHGTCHRLLQGGDFPTSVSHHRGLGGVGADRTSNGRLTGGWWWTSRKGSGSEERLRLCHGSWVLKPRRDRGGRESRVARLRLPRGLRRASPRWSAASGWQRSPGSRPPAARCRSTPAGILPTRPRPGRRSCRDS